MHIKRHEALLHMGARASLSSAESRSAAGPDSITNKDLKSMSVRGKTALLAKFNEVLSSGKWPDHWKFGEGIPLLKMGRDELSSYRIIVKTSQVVKLLERMILQELLALLEENDTLADQMTAYRPLKGPRKTYYTYAATSKKLVLKKVMLSP